MKILKKIILILVILIVIPFIVAIFVKKDYTVQREITIEKPKMEVFEYVKFLKNQDEYSKWAKMDTNMKQTFTGTDRTVGFISAWESENKDVGTGEQEIMKIIEGERIDYEIRFLKPMEFTNQAYMATKGISDNKTKVEWVFKGYMNYPMNVMLLFWDMDKWVGDDLDIGLKNLKFLLEKKTTQITKEGEEE